MLSTNEFITLSHQLPYFLQGLIFAFFTVKLYLRKISPRKFVTCIHMRVVLQTTVSVKYVAATVAILTRLHFSVQLAAVHAPSCLSQPTSACKSSPSRRVRPGNGCVHNYNAQLDKGLLCWHFWYKLASLLHAWWKLACNKNTINCGSMKILPREKYPLYSTYGCSMFDLGTTRIPFPFGFIL